MKFITERYDHNLAMWVKSSDDIFDTFEEADRWTKNEQSLLMRVAPYYPAIAAGTGFKVAMQCVARGQMPNGDLKVHVFTPTGEKFGWTIPADRVCDFTDDSRWP